MPLLDMRAEFNHAVEVAAWREACDRHADDMARIRIEALADLRRRHGDDFGYSVGGHWAISIEVSKRFMHYWPQMAFTHRHRDIQ